MKHNQRVKHAKACNWGPRELDALRFSEFCGNFDHINLLTDCLALKNSKIDSLMADLRNILN